MNSEDRNKRIEEIRDQAKQNAVVSSEARDKLFLLEEIDGLKEECAHYWNVMLSATADNERLRQELSRLQVERDAYYANAKYTEAAFHGITKLKAERDKAVEGLRWYANKVNYAISVTDNPFDSSPESVLIDEGEIARNVLSELGVSHDPLD